MAGQLLPGKKREGSLPSKNRRREIRNAWLFLLPSLIGVSIFVLIPFGDAVRRSFFDALGGGFVGWRNFEQVINNSAFRLAAGNMGKFLILCLPPLVIGSLLLAQMVARLRLPTRLFRTAFLLPMAIPVASVVLLWQAMFHQDGLLNNLLHIFGVQGQDWINSEWAIWVLVISYLWRNLGYDVILWLAGLSAISPELYEAAKTDGAGGWQSFRYITLPLLKPTAFTVLVLSLLNSFKVFREAYLVAGNYPAESIYLPQHLFNNWFLSFELQKICAGAVIVALFMLVVVLLLQLTINRPDGKG